VNRESEIWQFAAERLKQNAPVMLLVVAESTGSSPGRQGFKMAVAEDEMSGSIGGGVMEVALVEQARALLPVAPASNSFIRHQVHQKNSPEPSGMICSGKQTVIFFRLAPSHLEAVTEIVEALEKNERKILRITQDEFGVRASAGKDLPPEDGAQNKGWTLSKDSQEFTYEEKLGYKNQLFIVGGGHCALALSELMSKMDFHISLFDDRPNLNTLEKNKYVQQKNIIGSYEDIAGFIPSGADHFVVVMTLGYRSDELVIRKLMDKEFKYLGVLGSRAKMKTLLKELEKEGFPKEKLGRIRTPVGLHINSRTPEEIAVSIAAEIIAVKNSAK
jgi:xanthine dehydrogenase accessory factor